MVQSNKQDFEVIGNVKRNLEVLSMHVDFYASIRKCALIFFCTQITKQHFKTVGSK